MKRHMRLINIFLAIVVFLLVPVVSGLVYPEYQGAHAAYVGKGFGSDNDQAALNNSVSAAPISNNFFYYQLMSFTCAIFPFVGPDKCTNDESIFETLFGDSAMGNIAWGMGAMYANPPADLAMWIRDTQVALGFAKPVYAQGLGSGGLAPLLPIWKAFRNISYFLLALAMIVVGFMVMMRQKIDPKTVVTVQNSIPRIIIALILITFSYPIVGFLIDLMYLTIGIIAVFVKDAFPPSQFQSVNYANPGFTDFMFALFGPLVGFATSIFRVETGIPGQVGEWVSDMISGALFGASAVGPLFLFLVALAYLYAFIRLLFMLLGSYTQVLLGVITGPFQILIDVFPGTNGFTSWIKNLVANLAVFPITVLMLIVGNGVASQFGSQTLWTAPFLPQPQATPIGTVGGLGGLAQMLIALGVVLSIPNIANGIKETLKTKSPLEAGPGMIFGPLGRSAGTAMQGAFQISMVATGAKTLLGMVQGKGEQSKGE